MTEEEKAALEWFDRLQGMYGAQTKQNVGILKAMLAQPRLPAVAPMDAITAMIEAAANIRWCTGSQSQSARWRAIYNALYTLLTKPKTKTVEVWRVEYVNTRGEPAINTAGNCRVLAEDEADRLRVLECSCIHITGPHKQEVPRD